MRVGYMRLSDYSKSKSIDGTKGEWQPGSESDRRKGGFAGGPGDAGLLVLGSGKMRSCVCRRLYTPDKKKNGVVS